MLDPNTKVEIVANSDGWSRKLNINSVTTNWIFNAPTGDCQTYSLANIGDLISRRPNDWLEILTEVQRSVGKNCLLVNVRRDATGFKELKEFFKTDMIVNQDYTSTRDSSMCLLLINTNKLRARL